MENIKPERCVILVVDDESLLRMDAVDQLGDAGFDTLEAADAEAALGVLDHHPEISVLFTDINMPGPFDGLELARRVHERRPDVQLIITSGRRPPDPRDMPEDGRFITKPYDARLIAAMVRSAAG